MSKPKLTVIEGGLSPSSRNKNRFFVSSYVTDTRLMGVLTVYIHWKLSDPLSDADLHQFFYIDCEEEGFETYRSLSADTPGDLEAAEQALVGGLGAKKVEISLRQAKGILSHYKRFNEERDLPLPEGYDEYSSLIEPETALSREEYRELMDMICSDIVSDYQAVNYFLMRCFGQDYEGAAYLTSGSFPLDLYDSYRRATFCKNVIDTDQVCADGTISYLCESLVERDDMYETVISKVLVKDLKITGFEHCSGFPVSSVEAAMMLAKAEFVTVYEVLLSDEDMDNNLGELTVNLNTVMSTHENGRLFMVFKSNNDHVNSRIFRLSNDVKGIYFLTDYGQLILASYSISDIRALEKKLRLSPLAPFLMITSKYEFKEPVLFEFIQSDFEDFDEFLEYIRND